MTLMETPGSFFSCRKIVITYAAKRQDSFSNKTMESNETVDVKRAHDTLMNSYPPGAMISGSISLGESPTHNDRSAGLCFLRIQFLLSECRMIKVLFVLVEG
jgi:hypothetical protein